MRKESILILFFVFLNVSFSIFAIYKYSYLEEKELEIMISKYDELKEKGYFLETEVIFDDLDNVYGSFYSYNKTIVLDYKRPHIRTIVHEYGHYIWMNRFNQTIKDYYCMNFYDKNIFQKHVDDFFTEMPYYYRCNEDFARSFAAYITDFDSLDRRRIEFFSDFKIEN